MCVARSASFERRGRERWVRASPSEILSNKQWKIVSPVTQFAFLAYCLFVGRAPEVNQGELYPTLPML